MSETAMKWIEYVSVPGAAYIIASVILGSIERSRLGKQEKANPNRFTVKLPLVFVFVVLACFVIFTTITVFLNLQIFTKPSSVNLFTKIFLNVMMIALALTSLLYVYIFLRRKIEVAGGEAKVTPAFSKPYAFTVSQVRDVKYYEREIVVRVQRKVITVYRICHCSDLFADWLEGAVCGFF